LHLSNCQEINWDSHSLNLHWQQLQQRHQQWQKDSRTPLLTQLSDLPLAVLARWQQHYELPSLSIHLRSDIPIGQGLGSSASLIIALIQGLCQATANPLSTLQIQQMSTECEQLAHGKSSGLDVAAILLSDRLVWKQGQFSALATDTALPGYLVHTGKAQSSTADCVGWVRKHHASRQDLWSSMETATEKIAQSLNLAHASTALAETVNDLHECLIQLGVVPPKVQQFTQAAQALGWAGKLCGAGSISGEGGGFFWLLSEQDPSELCAEYGYPYWPLASLTEPSKGTNP
jgi:mevalonate kinase